MIRAIFAAALLPAALLLPMPAFAQDDDIRPFRARISDLALEDMQRRIRGTRWPDKETVADQSQGIQLEKLRPLVEYWGKDYDWRRAEAKLNAFPQFVTRIDGLTVHFIHVRSKHPDALPVIVTHGWPGSVFEQLKIIGPLTDPTAYGGKAEDAFDVIVPSLPGYGFSGKPEEPGWGIDRIARTWGTLMTRLGYRHYVAQGGDWGSPISASMARQEVPGLAGIHINLPAIAPDDVAPAIAAGGPAPAGLSAEERATFDQLVAAAKMGNRSYATMMGTRPQTIGYGVSDSPAGLAAWMLGHPGFLGWTFDASDPEKSPDEVLDDISLYWLTNSAASAGRIYWEAAGISPAFAGPLRSREIELPVGITVFPGESYQAPETWARRAYLKLVYFHKVDRGGHFAAWEQPLLFAEELRAAFRPMRMKETGDE